MVRRILFLLSLAIAIGSIPAVGRADEFETIYDVEKQPLGLRLPDYGPCGERLAPVSNASRGTGPGKAADKLPDYEMPPFDGIGANEYIVTTAHGVCDFISAVDTPAIWEFNTWYHTLFCGMTSRISGETDFPCI